MKNYTLNKDFLDLNKRIKVSTKKNYFRFMNVHLIRSAELKEETYRNVLHLLQQFQGPMHFLACEEDFFQYNEEDENRIWERKKDFEIKQNILFSLEDSNYNEASIKFPYVERVKTWRQLFEECDKYRKVKAVAENDIVVLLTDTGNDLNWFGGVSPSMKNYFIQTSHWEHYFGNDIDIRFPIAYEVIVWIMRYYMFADNEAIWNGVHQNPIGCIMDFCEQKFQIILKMRTADVCESCMNKFIERDVPVLYSRQFFDILDGIRKSMTFRGRSALLRQPSKLEIRGKNKKMFFTDLGGLELSLNPKEKALYLLFLKHEEGINITHLPDHREELMDFYAPICNQSEPELLNRAIDILINPFENDINVVLSRINRKIKEAVGDSLYSFYCIKGERGEIKRIKLDRELVNSMEN